MNVKWPTMWPTIITVEARFLYGRTPHVKLMINYSIRCHQWSTRPVPQSRQLWYLLSLWKLFYLARFWKDARISTRTCRRNTDDMCENSDPGGRLSGSIFSRNNYWSFFLQTIHFFPPSIFSGNIEQLYLISGDGPPWFRKGKSPNSFSNKILDCRLTGNMPLWGFKN